MLGQRAPRHVYLDTSVLVGAIVYGAPHAYACRQFCDELIAAGSRVYFSQILRLELSQALRRLATTRTNLSAAMRQQYQLDDWGTSAAVRSRWLTLGAAQFDLLLAQFAIAIELPFQVSTWAHSLDIMAQDGLQSRDAVHVATARQHGLRDLATVDADFQGIAGLQVQLIRNPSP
jgi:predicted nucleic acid-binding protein